MEYSELIRELAAKCGVEQPDTKDGTVVFEIDDLTVGLIHDPAADAMMVVVEFGEPNPAVDEVCSSALLKANYLFAGTGGATLCRNPETGAFAITRSWPLVSLDVDTFETAINDLLATAEKWKAVVEGIDIAHDVRDEQIEEESEVLKDSPRDDGGFMRV